MEEVERRLEGGEEIWQEMTERGEDIEKQERRSQIEESRYAREVKRAIVLDNIPEYQENGEKNRKGEISITGRYRMGSENKSSRYWMKEEDRNCRICKREKEILEHVFEKCTYTKQTGKTWEERLKGGKENLAALY